MLPRPNSPQHRLGRHNAPLLPSVGGHRFVSGEVASVANFTDGQRSERCVRDFALALPVSPRALCPSTFALRLLPPLREKVVEPARELPMRRRTSRTGSGTAVCQVRDRLLLDMFLRAGPSYVLASGARNRLRPRGTQRSPRRPPMAQPLNRPSAAPTRLAPSLPLCRGGKPRRDPSKCWQWLPLPALPRTRF